MPALQRAPDANWPTAMVHQQDWSGAQAILSVIAHLTTGQSTLYLKPGLVDNYPLAGEETFSDIDQTLASLTMNWQLQDWTLTSVTGYYDQDANTFDWYDAHTFAQVPVAEEELYTSISQEVRLLSNLDGPLNYLIGAFYQDIDQTFNNNAKVQALGADPRSTVPKYHWWEKRGETDGQTISVFAQLMWDITDRWELSAGIRYTDEKKDSSLGHDWIHLIAQLAAFGAPAGKRFEDEFTDENWSPEATLAWRPTDELMLYGSYRTGFKSGGMAHSASLLGYIPGVSDDALYTSNFTFDSEKIDGFEGGF